MNNVKVVPPQQSEESLFGKIEEMGWGMNHPPFPFLYSWDEGADIPGGQADNSSRGDRFTNLFDVEMGLLEMLKRIPETKNIILPRFYRDIQKVTTFDVEPKTFPIVTR